MKRVKRKRLIVILIGEARRRQALEVACEALVRRVADLEARLREMGVAP